MSESPRLARQMWHQIEPVHAPLYFAPQAFEAASSLGYDIESRWPSYFAWRAAPLGPAGPNLVTATFYSFSPATVAQYVSDAWTVAAPELVVKTRLEAMDRVLRSLIGDQVGFPEIAEAAELAKQAAESANVSGRALAAANLDQPWAEEPHLALWQAYTILREHRGDGHLAALAAAELDGCESLVSFAAIGAAPVANFQGRGWTSDEWAAAQDRLAARGLVDGTGTATEEGRRLRDQVERMTDQLAAGPWRSLGAAKAERLAQLNLPLLGAVFETGMLPSQSTLGIGAVQAPS
ncbi:hypothetical protein J5X84_07025 [Streptosporangiaceae bacterium NEAU-GS5]|nr:hypothetical protein [Streptosporangiaceae bacterium NEAU-GS5]